MRMTTSQGQDERFDGDGEEEHYGSVKCITQKRGFHSAPINPIGT